MSMPFSEVRLAKVSLLARNPLETPVAEEELRPCNGARRLALEGCLHSKRLKAMNAEEAGLITP